MFEPFEERLKKSNKYLNGNYLTFEDCDFVTSMRFAIVLYKYFANVDLFMDFPYITKFVNEIQSLPAHEIANNYHLNLSTNRYQNDMEHVIGVRYLIDHYGINVGEHYIRNTHQSTREELHSFIIYHVYRRKSCVS